MTCLWKTFLPDVLPFISSPAERFRRPPYNVAIHFLRLGAMDYLRESTLLRDKYCPDLQCGVTELPLFIPEGRELLQIHSVKDADTGEKYTFTHEDSIVTLTETPAEDVRRGACITYSYLLDLQGCEPPEILCKTEHRPAIRAYMLSLLLDASHMDWYDPRGAEKQRRLATSLAAKARSKAANKGGKSRKSFSAAMEGMFWGM